MLGKPKIYTKHFSDVRNSDFEIVGDEALLTSELYNANIPIQSGFIVTTFGFDDYLLFNQIVEPILEILKDVKPFIKESAVEASEKITSLIMNGEFQRELYEQVTEEYLSLSESKSGSFVSVEISNIINSKYIPLNFIESKINDIRGEHELMNKIRLLWLTLFTVEAIELRTNSYYKGEISSAVIIKKMNLNELSGKIYTFPPTTREEDLFELTAYYGMEDLSGEAENYSDRYKIEFETLNIKEKQIVPQSKMIVRTGKKKEKDSPYKRVEISKEWQKKQKLSDELITKISKEFQKVEEINDEPLEISWGIQAGKWFITDIKDLKVDTLTEEEDSTDLSDLLETAETVKFSEEVNKPKLNELQKEIEEMLNIPETEDKLVENMRSLGIRHESKEITLPKKSETSSQQIVRWSNKYDLKTKILLDISKLHSGNLHSIEEFDGTFFDGTESILAHDFLPETQFEDEVKYNRLVDSYTIDITLAAQNSSPKEMLYQFSNITEMEYKMLGVSPKDSIFIGDERFIQRPESMIAEIHAVMKSINSYKAANVSLSFPSVRSVKNLSDMIRILDLQGLRKSESLNYYAELAIPSFAYDIADIDRKLVDGIIINYDLLLKLSVFRKEARKVDHEILIKMIHNVLKTCRLKNLVTGIMVFEFNPEIMAKLTLTSPDFFIFGNMPSEDVMKEIAKAEKGRK